MNLEQFLAALAAGGQQATDALAQATPDLLGQALEHYSTEVTRLSGADVELTEENVTALETAVQLRGQVASQQGLAARRDAAAAAMSAENGNPGSDAEPDLTTEAQDTAGRHPDQARDGRTGGRPPERVSHQNGQGGNQPADGQRTQETGGPTGPGGVEQQSTGGTGTSDQGGTAMRQRGGIAQFRADAQTAPPEVQTAGQVATVARAGAGMAEFEAGQRLETDAQFYDTFVERAGALFGPGGRGADGRYHVVRVESDYPEARTLGSSERENNSLVAAAIGEQTQRDSALVAAGGLCAPLDVRYDINVLGVTNRPIRQALTSFQVPRGGIQYRAPMDALAMTEGMGIWTMEMDASVPELPNPNADIPEPFKTCFVAECPGTVEAILYSTYLCMEFPNITARFDREWVSAATQGALISWARFAENNLLARMAAASKIVVGKRQLSATRDILATYDKAISRYRNRHRLDDSVRLHTIMPRWVIDMIRTDVMRGMVTTGASDVSWAVTRAWIEGLFATRNVGVTWHLDGLDEITKNGVTIPAQHYGDLSEAAGQVVAPWPTAIDSLLYVEGDWLYLDGGTMDFGLVRDSSLNARNRYRTFTENFEGVAFTGLESWRLVLPVEPTGAMVGTVPPGNVDDTAGTVADAMGIAATTP